MNVRTRRGSLAFTAPHPEHVFDDGNHRLATTRFPPFHAVLQASWRRISPNPASETARASFRCRTIPETLRSSTTMVPYSRVRLAVSLWIASRRGATTWWWTWLRCALARRHRLDGRCPVRRSGPTFRETDREARRSFRSAEARCFGFSAGARPSENTANILTPRSTPSTASGREGLRSARSRAPRTTRTSVPLRTGPTARCSAWTGTTGSPSSGPCARPFWSRSSSSTRWRGGQGRTRTPPWSSPATTALHRPLRCSTPYAASTSTMTGMASTTRQGCRRSARRTAGRGSP